MNKYEKAICGFLKAANVPDRRLYEREVAAAGILYTLGFHDETLYAVSVYGDWAAEKAYMLIPEDRRPEIKGDPYAPPRFEPGGYGEVGLRAGETAVRLSPPYPDGNPTAPDILQRAAQHMQDRAAARDQPGGERSMRRTVDAFNALTGHNVSERDGWLFMAVLKMARATTTPTGTEDDYEDLCAYSALAGESAR